MADIWPIYEGREPTVGGPWASLPILEAVSLFELKKRDFVSDLDNTPRFGDVNRDLRSAGFKYIVVEIMSEEANKARLEPGFYKSKITPKEAFQRLVQQALTTVLGKRNVVRVEQQSTMDSQDREAIKIIVVLAPRASGKLADLALDALVSVRERLREMNEDRYPIVEYATEAELQTGGGTKS